MLSLLFIAVGCSPEAGQSPRSAESVAPQSADITVQPSDRFKVVPGQWLVKFDPKAAAAGRAKLLASLPVRIKQTYRSVPGLQLVEASAGTDRQALVAALTAIEGVQYVEPNVVYRALAIPNDPEFPRQRGLNNVGQFAEQPQAVLPDIEAPAAWDLATGSDQQVVAIIDSGIDLAHEDLVANIFRNEVECVADGIDTDGNGHIDDCHGIDTANADSDPTDDDGHGTHVAGIVGAVGDNGIGIAGVAWRVKLLPCKFLDREGQGSTDTAIRCLDYIAMMKERGVNIIATNNSWGGGLPSRALDDAIAVQRQHGILFVTAAGNSRENNDLMPSYPCATDHSNVICVADAYDQIVPYSSFGSATVHLGAPGSSILSTMPGNRYEMMDGTSMAAPHVTGTLVLLAAQDPSRDGGALKNLVLTATQSPTFGPRLTVTNGRLDASRALDCQDASVLARLRPSWLAPITRPVAAPLVLKALHVRCANPAGVVTVSVAPSGDVVTLVDDGRGEDEAAGDGVYTGAWSSLQAGTYTLTFETPERDELTVHVDPQLRLGFPKPTLAISWGGYSVRPEPDGLVVGNIAGDNSLEILTSAYDYGPLHAWHHDGRDVLGWPAYDAPLASTLALGEFDGDPRSLEVAGTDKLRGTRLYRGDGTTLPGWPSLNDSFHLGRAPATFDFDGDGHDELLTVPARRIDGSVFSTADFPKRGTLIHTAPVVADLDADGEAEIIVADEKQLWVSNRAGVFPGFPVQHAPGVITMLPQPVVGDVTGDGRPDIVLMSVEYGVPQWIMHAEVFDRRGRPQSAWSAPVDPITLLPSVADLTGDGIPEILMQDGSSGYAWNGAGVALPGWPVTLSKMFVDGAQPVVGDIDGDGKPDVVFVRGHGTEPRGSLEAYDRSGRPIAGYPKPLWAASSPATPAIADLDRDGRNEVIVASMPDYGLRDGVYVFNSPSSAASGPVEWGQFMEGPARRGYYALGKTLASDAYLATQVFGAGRITSTDSAIDCGAECLRKYPRGATVTLNAAARTGGRFTGWKGACTGTSSICTVSMNALREVSADFDSPVTVQLAGTGTGGITADTGGLSCPGQCTDTYPARSVVTLTATASAGSAFDSWGGACTGSQPTCTVIVDDARQVVANFINARTLTVAAAGAGQGRIFTNDGAIDCGSRCSAGFPPGTTVRLRAEHDARSYVERWSAPGCMYEIDHCDVAVDDLQSVTVTFGRNPVFTVIRTGTGSVRVTTSPAGIDCGATCTAPLPHDSLIEFRALPAPDTYVVRWADCSAAGSYPTCSMFSGTADRTVAVETALKPKIQLTFAGQGTGAVMSTTSSMSCTASCSAPADPFFPTTIYAQAASGSTFAGWGGACAGQGSSCTLTVTADTNVTVSFDVAPGSGSGSGGGNGGSTGGGSTGGSSGGGNSGGGGSASGLLLLLLFSAGVRRGRRGRSDRFP